MEVWRVALVLALIAAVLVAWFGLGPNGLD